MLRWLLVGLLLMGVGVGFQRQWILLDGDKMSADLNLPNLSGPQGIKRLGLFGAR